MLLDLVERQWWVEVVQSRYLNDLLSALNNKAIHRNNLYLNLPEIL